MMINFQESRYPLQSKDPHGEFLHPKKKKNQRARVMMANNSENVFPYT